MGSGNVGRNPFGKAGSVNIFNNCFLCEWFISIGFHKYYWVNIRRGILHLAKDPFMKSVENHNSQNCATAMMREWWQQPRKRERGRPKTLGWALVGLISSLPISCPQFQSDTTRETIFTVLETRIQQWETLTLVRIKLIFGNVNILVGETNHIPAITDTLHRPIDHRILQYWVDYYNCNILMQSLYKTPTIDPELGGKKFTILWTE